MKLSFQPINDAHSIVELVFFFSFSSSFRKEDILDIKEILNRKYSKFNKDTPVYNLEHQFKINSEDSPSVDSKKTTLSGFELESLDESGKINWGLSLSDNKLLIHCLNYSSWENISCEAINYIFDVLEVLKDDSSLLISNFGLKYLDKFLCNENIQRPIVLDLFNIENKYLAKNTLESGNVWHCNSGWFEDVEEDFVIEKSHVFKCLNQLGVESSISNHDNVEKIVISIDNGCFLIPKNIEKDTQKYGISINILNKEYINKCFDLLHNKNKDILKGLLTKDMSKRINLH